MKVSQKCIRYLIEFKREFYGKDFVKYFTNTLGFDES
jgi:hypothetical protein